MGVLQEWECPRDWGGGVLGLGGCPRTGVSPRLGGYPRMGVTLGMKGPWGIWGWGVVSPGWGCPRDWGVPLL